MFTDLTRARAEVTAHSVAGAPFLLAFGLTIGIVGLMGFWLPTKTAALVLMFQGNVALPLAFLIERRLRWSPASPDNPLRGLAIQLAMSQLAALPMVLVAYSVAPNTVGVAVASVAAGHLVPYGWLHRTHIYLWLAPAVSIGTLAIAVALGRTALPWTLLYMSGAYLVAARLLYRHAHRLRGTDLCYASTAEVAAADSGRRRPGDTRWHTEGAIPAPYPTGRP